MFGNEIIPQQDSLDILGVEADSCLHFDRYLQKVTQIAFQKVNLLSKMKHLQTGHNEVSLFFWSHDALQGSSHASHDDSNHCTDDLRSPALTG